RSSHAGSNVLF
nr:immunoglobulin light chain junction region [Macaca mulatta]